MATGGSIFAHDPEEPRTTGQIEAVHLCGLPLMGFSGAGGIDLGKGVPDVASAHAGTSENVAQTRETVFGSF